MPKMLVWTQIRVEVQVCVVSDMESDLVSDPDPDSDLDAWHFLCSSRASSLAFFFVTHLCENSPYLY